jgi:hypothetical protein
MLLAMSDTKSPIEPPPETSTETKDTSDDVLTRLEKTAEESITRAATEGAKKLAEEGIARARKEKGLIPHLVGFGLVGAAFGFAIWYARKDD